MPVEWGLMLQALSNRCFANNIEKFCEIPDRKKVFECYENAAVREESSKWIESTLSVHRKTTKSSKKSEQLRQLGNAKFRVGDDETSLKLYTESIIHAPRGSKELSLALGNRSAALFRLQQFENCIRDVNLALRTYENVDLFPKLMIRKSRALRRLRKFEDGLRCLNAAKQSIVENETLSTSQKSKIIDEFENELNQNSLTVNEDHDNKVNVLPAVLEGDNESFPYASNLLELKTCPSDSENNRRVIARATIEPGDMLFVENPFSSVVLPDHYKNHCQFCCRPLTAPIACSECTECLYCNDECQEKGYNRFHKWECEGLPLLQGLGVGHLALRTTLLAVQNSNSIHYRQVNDLVTHLGDVPGHDLLQYALTAALLVVYLERYTDFLTSQTRSIEDTGFLLLRHMIQIICNGFAIKKSNIDSYNLTMELSQVTYATGLYPSAAMMNHSCGPNIVTSFYNNLLVVRASKRIEKGDEVFNCYGPHYRKLKTEERQAILKSQFFFDCKCDYCQLKDDPVADESTVYVCLKCKRCFNWSDQQDSLVRCRSCLQCTDVQSYNDLFQKTQKLLKMGSDMMMSENFERAAHVLKKCKLLQQTFLHANDIGILNNVLDLAECYYELGEYTSSWKCFKECVPIVRELRGEYSIQYADVIRKTIEMFLLDFRSTLSLVTDEDCIADLLRYVDDLIRTVDLNFGTWSAEYLSVQSVKRELSSIFKVSV